MTMLDLARQAQNVLRRNSPAILTAIGVSGSITTAYFSVKGTLKAVEVLEDKYQVSLTDIPLRKHDVKHVWRFYIPAGISGSVTIAAIIAASKASSRRTAAITAAYSLSETAFAEYKEKVIEKLGERKEQAVRDEIVQERVNREAPTMVIASGKVMCCELYTGRYFESTMETLKKAVNDINADLIHHTYANLNDLYYLVGLEPTQNSGYIGWDSDKLLELRFTTVMAPDDKPCIAFEYNYVKPI